MKAHAASTARWRRGEPIGIVGQGCACGKAPIDKREDFWREYRTRCDFRGCCDLYVLRGQGLFSEWLLRKDGGKME